MKRIFTLLGIGLMSFYGQSQTALDFEETTNQYIDVGNSVNAVFTGSNNITLESWVKLESSGTFRTIAGNYNTSMQFLLRIDNGIATFWVENGTGYTNVNGTSTIPIGTWTHIAGSWDGTSMKVYVNGMLENSTSYSGAFPSSTNSLRVGGSLTGSEYMDGLIDDVRIWNITRTDAEILADKDLCLTGTESGLVALYDFDIASGSVLPDITGNGFDGNLVNSPVWSQGKSCTTCPSDQTVAITDTTLCPTNTGTTITTASSEAGVAYYLRDNANDTIVDGPLFGTGSGLIFNTGSLTSSMDYNVYALVPNNVTSLTMDGIDEYVSTPNVIQNNEWTYETWVKPNDLSPDWSGIITSNSGVGSGMWFQLSLSNTGKLRWESNSPSLYINDIGPIINDNEWHHVAVTCDGLDISFYVDGALVEQQTFSGGSMNRPLHIMAERVPTQYVSGQVDETMVWNYARPATLILSDMSACLDGTEPGLLIYFDYEDGIGSTVTDLAGNDHNGILMNMEDTDWTNTTNFINNCPNCTLEMSSIISVTVHDIVAPLADNATLSDLTDECSVSMPTAPTATDNCSGAITGTTTTTFPITTQGTTVVTWTYDDGNGNTSTQMQNVVITDVTAPVADITTLTDVTATCEVTSLTDPTATDNCSGTVTVTNDATLPINTIGTTVVTWTYDDGNGNTSTQTQNVIVSSPSIDVTTTTTDLTITANNITATSYQWLDCNNNNMPITGETNASYTATVNGDYSVIVTEGSCSDTSNCVAITTVGVNELTDLGVSIYPNPNNGTFTISTAANNVFITVYSVDGKIIINHLPITQTNQTINLEGVESGVYFVNVVNSTNQKTIRLVVE